jgi:hypothetical protein
MRLLFRALALCLATVACADVFEPEFPPNAVLVTPPVQYRIWWEMIESCSGHTASFDAVRWYRVPIGEGLRVQGESAAGAWFAAENAIAIGDGWRANGSLVRHEILHAVLQDGSHPDEYFRSACGDEVLCGRDCAGETVLSNAIPLTVEQLNVDATLFPRHLSLGRYDGQAAVVVRVRNPYNVNAFVNAHHFVHATCPVGFVMKSLADSRRYDEDCRPLRSNTSDTRVYFRPGEIRHVVFDLNLRSISSGPFYAEAAVLSAILMDQRRGAWEVTIAP